MDAEPVDSKALDLPKELWLLVDHLQKRGMKEVVYFPVIIKYFENTFAIGHEVCISKCTINYCDFCVNQLKKG